MNEAMFSGSVHLEEALPEDTDLNMHLLLPDGQPEPMECFATIIDKCVALRPSDWTATVAFDDLPEETRARLGAFLSQELLRR